MAKKKTTEKLDDGSEERYSAIGYRGPGKFAKMQLVSAVLTAKNKLKVKYNETNELGMQEHSVKLDHIAHEDLVNAFDALGYDLLSLTEQPEVEMGTVDNFTPPEGLAVFHVSFGARAITGEKLSSKITGGTVSLSTPIIDYSYERYEEVSNIFNLLDYEVKLYLNGKQRAEQAKLDLDQHDEDGN